MCTQNVLRLHTQPSFSILLIDKFKFRNSPRCLPFKSSAALLLICHDEINHIYICNYPVSSHPCLFRFFILWNQNIQFENTADKTLLFKEYVLHLQERKRQLSIKLLVWQMCVFNGKHVRDRPIQGKTGCVSFPAILFYGIWRLLVVFSNPNSLCHSLVSVRLHLWFCYATTVIPLSTVSQGHCSYSTLVTSKDHTFRDPEMKHSHGLALETPVSLSCVMHMSPNTQLDLSKISVWVAPFFNVVCS